MQVGLVKSVQEDYSRAGRPNTMQCSVYGTNLQGMYATHHRLSVQH